MYNPEPYKSNLHFKDNPYNILCESNTAYAIRNGVKNNDYLLKQLSITLADQLRTIEGNGVKITRSYYYQLRNGERYGGSIKWLSYFMQYWINLGYNINILDFQSYDFQDLFINRIKPERDAAI